MELDIEQLNKTVKELTAVCEQQDEQLKIKTSEVSDLTNSVVNLTTIIKNTQIVLASNREVFEDNEDLIGITDQLNKFVMSSGAIKVGAIKNAKN